MLKHIFTTLVFSLVLLVSNGQKKSDAPVESDNQYYDLLMYYMDGEFEKCLKKATKITEDEESAKDPLPYLYASMSFYEIADKEEFKEDYPNALKDALKYAVKFRKKDERMSAKEKKMDLQFWKDNQAYISKLRTRIKETAQTLVSEGRDSKAAYFYKQLTLLDPEDYSAWYMMSIITAEDVEESQKNFAEFSKSVQGVANFRSEPEDRLDLLKTGFMLNATRLIKQGKQEQARKEMYNLKTILGEDKEIEDFLTKYQLL